jgi:hypothetical protein
MLTNHGPLSAWFKRLAGFYIYNSAHKGGEYINKEGKR